MCSCACSKNTPFYNRCGPLERPRANNAQWKICPMRFETGLWYITYDANLCMTLEVIIEEAYKYYIDMPTGFERRPDIAWVDENNRSAGGIRMSSAFTVLGREGDVIKTKFTIKIFSLLRKFILANTKLTDKDDIWKLIQLWINYRRSQEFAEEKRWREYMSAYR